MAKFIFICGGGIVSGKEFQTLNTMIELRKRGHELICFSSFWGSGEFAKLLTENRIPYKELRLGFISKSFNAAAIRMTLHQMLFLPSLWVKFIRETRSFQPEHVIHTNFHHVFLLLPVLTKKNNHFYAHDAFPSSRFFRIIFSLFNRKFNSFIGVSEFICDGLRLLVPARKVSCVYNGLPIQDFKLPPLPDERTRIGIIGQIGEWKGHSVLIAAAAHLLRSNANLELVIIGEGTSEFKTKLNTLAKSEGVQNQVKYLGRINGLHNIYKNLQIVCVPSLFQEPFGLTAVEAGYFRIPVIASNIGGLPEVIEDQVTGLVVEPGNIPAWEAAISRLVSDPMLRQKMGNAAHERVLANFTVQKSVTRLLSHLGLPDRA